MCQGRAIARKVKSMRACSRSVSRFLANQRTGTKSARGTRDFARTARPSKAADHGRLLRSPWLSQGSANKMPAEKRADTGRSGTPDWLKATHHAEDPRGRELQSAALGPKSHRS